MNLWTTAEVGTFALGFILAFAGDKLSSSLLTYGGISVFGVAVFLIGVPRRPEIHQYRRLAGILEDGCGEILPVHIEQEGAGGSVVHRHLIKLYLLINAGARTQFKPPLVADRLQDVAQSAGGHGRQAGLPPDKVRCSRSCALATRGFDSYRFMSSFYEYEER